MPHGRRVRVLGSALPDRTALGAGTPPLEGRFADDDEGRERMSQRVTGSIWARATREIV
jgi:hypothetical protein